MSQSPRVLSIQSHVVHGYVGNKSSTFPLQVHIHFFTIYTLFFVEIYEFKKIKLLLSLLQVLGFEVDAINSVQFSNHTYYEHVKGQIMNEIELCEIFEALKSNNLLHKYSHLSSGYIGNASFLKYIVEIVKTLKIVNPNLIYGK